MTDADLLRLIEEKLPADFTDAELTALRERCASSPEVRAALAARLELETELSAGLSEVTLSIDDLMTRAAARPGSKTFRGSLWRIVGGIAGLLLVTGIGVWWFNGKAPARVESLAARSPEMETSPDATIPKKPSPAGTQSTATPSAEETLAATMPGDAVPSAPAATPPVVEGPWTPWLNGEIAPLAVEDRRWRADLRTIGHDEIPLAEFQRWWEEVPGIAAGWNEAIIGGRRTVQLDGRVQLKAPWVDDAVLRLTPFDLNDLTLLFGDQERGVALRFYRQREPHQWAAYEFQRPPGETAIKWGGLLTTDSGAWYRSGASTFEVRRQDGQLILSTGQIPILTVPLPNTPSVVQLLARGRLRGFSWLRGEPWPLAEKSTHPVVFQTGDAAATEWTSVKPETAMVHVDASGTVSMTGSSKTEESLAFVRLPKATLVESIVRLSSADAGTGVYLGNEQGKPLVMLGVFQDKRAKQLAFGPLRPGDRRVETEFDPNAFPPPYWSPQVWLKIVAGLGCCHVWTSGDGVHWGHIAENPLHEINGAIRSLGVYCVPGETPRTIRLEQFRVQELSGVTHLAGNDKVDFSVELSQAIPQAYGDWEAAIAPQLPEQVEPARWMERAAVATLQAGPTRSLAREIIEHLAESSRFRALGFQDQCAFLDDVSALLDTANDPNLSLIRQKYFLHADDSPGAGQQAWQALLQSPLWTPHPQVRQHRTVVARQLLASAFAQDRDRTASIAADAQFWMATAHPDHRFRYEDEALDRLARWSRSVTGATDRQADGIDVLPLSWRHPSQLTINKEAYNVRSELRSALVGGNFGDAGRIALNFGVQDGVGLLPDMDDEALFVSIPVAMATAVQDYPAFGDALRNDLGPTGLVRVTQAARRGDLATLRAATIQFYGTAAAAEAERVLGDRQMAIGDYFGAQRAYRRAARSATEAQREALQGRQSLAETLMGVRSTQVDPAVVATLKVDGVPLAPILQEFPSNGTTAASSASSPHASLPKRARYRVETKNRFDGQVGQNAGRNEFRQVDAFGRQFAVTVDESRFYVSNRFQVTAYHRDSGEQLWAASVGSDQGEAHGQRFTPMTPHLIDGRLLVRRMTKAGVELAALMPQDGQVIWKTRTSDQANVLSDAVSLAGRLAVLVAHRVEEDSLELRWTHLNPVTGDIIAQFPLLRLRDSWNGDVPSSLAVKHDHVVAVVGGVILAFDVSGNVLWMRRETWLPPKIDPQADDYLHSPPSFFGDASQSVVVVASPSSREVQAIDVHSGRTRWKNIVPTLQGLLTATDTLVVLSTSTELTGLSPMTGAVVWQRSIPDRMTGLRVDGDQFVIAIQRESANKKAWPQLAWFDLATGVPRGEAQLELDDQNDWQLGPFFTVGETWWTLIGRPGTKPQRDLARLLPVGEPAPQPWSDPQWDNWLTPGMNERRTVQSVLPGWQPLSFTPNAFAVPASPVRDQQPVLIAKSAKAAEPVRFLRTIKVGDNPAAGLQVRVGHQSGQRWQLEVRVGNRVLLSEPVTDETAPNGWLEKSVPLATFAGQAVTLQLLQANLDNKPIEGLWHEVRIIGGENP